MLEFQEKSEEERDRKFLELEEIVETKKFVSEDRIMRNSHKP